MLVLIHTVYAIAPLPTVFLLVVIHSAPQKHCSAPHNPVVHHNNTAVHHENTAMNHTTLQCTTTRANTQSNNEGLHAGYKARGDTIMPFQASGILPTVQYSSVTR